MTELAVEIPEILYPTWLERASVLLAEPDPGPTKWLIENIIVDQALTATVGRWKTTKTYWNLDAAISIVTGRPFLDAYQVPEPGPVIIVLEESGRAALWRRLDSLARGRAIDRDQLGELHTAANKRVKLDDAAWQQDLVAAGKELQPRMILLDPLARMKAANRQENEQSDMGILIDFMRYLRDETGAAVNWTHHTGHQGEHMRGASDLESVWETRLGFKKDGNSITVTPEHREAEPTDPIGYRLVWDETSRTISLKETESKDITTAGLIKDHLLHHPKSRARDIAKGIAVRATDVERVLAELTADGTLIKGRSGAVDKLGRPLRDEVYSLNHDLRDGASQTPIFALPRDEPPAPSHVPDEPQPEHGANGSTTPEIARPDTGTNQDDPLTRLRELVARPTPVGGTPGTSHREDADDDIPF